MRFFSLIFVIWCFFLNVPARAETFTLPEAAAPVPLHSAEGRRLFARAEAKADFFLLVNQYEPQRNRMFCGPASAAIILNALRLSRIDRYPAAAPSDGLSVAERMLLPEGVDASLRRYTQENILAFPEEKTRAEVLGGGTGEDYGMQLEQLASLLRKHGAQVIKRVAGEDIGNEAIKNELIANMADPGDAVLVNYRRDALGQEGGGHISPLAAYNGEEDKFLILDVNPSRAPFAWVKAGALIDAMRTFDTEEHRGYLLIKEGRRGAH